MAKKVIEVKNLYKDFILPKSKNDSFKTSFVNIFKKNEKIKQEVLRGVSFDVEEGDFFGIVGRNGSGKSTLLKILAGVYYPTAGEVNIKQRLTPFIELGVGFNPNLSGRDNVFLNGALLGFSRQQMNAMYHEIVEFAELEPFMDQKLKNYSSGMQVRLAFSVAVKSKNPILIFDEVLAVGDMSFQDKCIRQFNEFRKEGRTIILVTHSMDQVEKFCNKSILIHEGKIIESGSTEKVIDKYNALNMGTLNESSDKNEDEHTQVKDVEIENVRIVNKNNEEEKLLDDEEDFAIKFNIKSNKDINNTFLAVRICESENQFIVTGFDNKEKKIKVDIKKGDNEFNINIKNNPLIAGKYYLLVALFDTEKRKVNYDFYNGLHGNNLFMVKNKKKKFGIIKIDNNWN